MNTSFVELTLRFRQDLSYLHLATGTSRLVCETIDEPHLPRAFTDEVELAVSEACTNAIRHGVDGDPSAVVTVNFRLCETHLDIEVSDHGAGFDFAGIPEPEFDSHPETGYGLFIIRNMMDEVRYERGSSINTLAMKKYIRQEGDFER